MAKDRNERPHRRTTRHPECVRLMAEADFDREPTLAEAMGLTDPDPDATAEYGPHPEGEARWQALQAEVAADAARPALAADVTDSEIPF